MSIKKISELANTSPSTVSRVLNDPEHICHDPELAKRIWEIAGKLNYLPNSAARELRKGKTKQATSLLIHWIKTLFFTNCFNFFRVHYRKTDAYLGIFSAPPIL